MSGFIPFLHANKRWLLGGFLLTFFSGFGQTFFISLFAPEIKQTFDLTNGGWGWVYMVATLGSAATLIYLGPVVDKFGIAAVAVAVALCLAAASVGMAFIGGSIVFLIAVVFALRLFGQGMMTHVSMTAMGRWFVGNRGRAVSIATLGHQGSELLFPLAFLALAASLGWRNAWLAAAILLVAFAPFLLWLLKKERDPATAEPEQQSTSYRRQWTRKEMLRDPLFHLLMAGVLAPPFIGTSIFFHQAHLMEIKGLARGVFAGGLGVMAVVTIVFALVAGSMVDRFSAVRVARYFLLPLGSGCVVLASFDTQMAVFGFLALMGVSYGFASTLGGALLPEIYGTAHLGSIRAVLVAAMVFLTAAGPGLTGTLIDVGIGFETQIMVMAIYCLFATFLLVFVSRLLVLRLASEEATG